MRNLNIWQIIALIGLLIFSFLPDFIKFLDLNEYCIITGFVFFAIITVWLTYENNKVADEQRANIVRIIENERIRKEKELEFASGSILSYYNSTILPYPNHLDMTDSQREKYITFLSQFIHRLLQTLEKQLSNPALLAQPLMHTKWVEFRNYVSGFNFKLLVDGDISDIRTKLESLTRSFGMIMSDYYIGVDKAIATDPNKWKNFNQHIRD